MSALRRPEDWDRLLWRARWLPFISSTRRAAMVRLAYRWRLQDHIEWVCT